LGQVLGEHGDHDQPRGLTANDALSRRLRARDDDVWPDVYDALPGRRIKEVGRHIGVDDSRQLVAVRHMLARVLVDQLRTMAGDPVRRDVKDRRKKLQVISKLASSLRDEFEAALPDIMTDHQEADWHESVQWGPSYFRYDYEQLLCGAHVIEKVCADILESPAFNVHQNKGFGPTGLPAKLPNHPGSWAKTAFANRLARLFATASGRQPTVSNSQESSFQKFAAECIDVFAKAYGELEKPFGAFAPPSRRHLREACARHK
jgi:hypothetical protein